MNFKNNQTVVFGSEVYGERTGEIVGQERIDGKDFYIVLLDFAVPDGRKALLVPGDAIVELNCHWCRDAKQVQSGSFTIEQYEKGTIPLHPCPYCNREEYLKWATKD
jgi:hypothetical protein